MNHSQRLELDGLQLELDGLQFAEDPRWHDGRLWCSDMFGHRVVRGLAGQVEQVVDMPFDNPSGLGWLPTGALLVVGMQTQAVYRVQDGGDLTLYADFAGAARGMANDMVVARDGTAYVGDIGIPGFGRVAERRPGQIFAVAPDGKAVVAADDLEVPNGMVVTPDGRTLIVAESFAARLTAYDIATDGSLHGRRVHAELHPPPDGADPVHPDGICLDADGGVWVADLTYRRVIRILPDGSLGETVSFAPLVPIACMLGGPDRGRLFVCLSQHVDLTKLGTAPASHVASIAVSTTGAGWP